MKYGLTAKIFGIVLTSFLKEIILDKKVIKNIKKEYKAIVLRSKDIGQNNMLLSSYLLAAYFIAMNRNDGLAADENGEILDKSIRQHSSLIIKLLGSKEEYLSEKKNVKRREWSKETKLHKYENDWEVDFLEKTEDYDFGLDYKKCGVCALCKDENCPELAKYLCKLDFTLVEIMGVNLKRTKTLANGDECCDFRFSGK